MNDLTLYQFNVLDNAEQYSIVWEYGVHVSERIEGEHRLVLYQLFSFYVEFYYHMEDNVIQKLRSFSSTKPLEPYLQDINISDISKF